MATITVYPQPGTTVDGIVKRDVASESWSTLHDHTDANEVDYIGTTYSSPRIKADTTSNMWEIITRSIILFDTSAIDDAATITAAVLSLKGFSKTDTLSASPTVDIYTSAPASNTVLANGDYDSLGTTSQTGSPITYASWSTSAYNDFTFNSTGRGNISKTGISKFGVRNANYDAANTPPTWVSGASIIFAYYSSNESGTTSDPKLVITYSVSTDYPMTAAQGSFTLTSQSTILRYGRKIIAAYGAFALTGQNVLLRLGKGMQAVYGSFALTGQNAILRIAMRMIAAQGSFAQTMQTVIFRYGKTMSATVGNFVLNGQDILLHLGRKMVAAVGTFALTGQTALLKIGRTILAAVGSFVLSGQIVLLKVGWKMQAAYTTFALTGQTVLLKVGRNIVAAYGAFTLTGQSILFHIAMRMQAVYGQITLTGQTVLFAVNGLYVRWTTAIKNAVATLANRAKNSSTWTNRDKTL